jgi:hypothetical protein
MGGKNRPISVRFPTGKIFEKPFDSSALSATLRAEMEHGGVHPE